MSRVRLATVGYHNARPLTEHLDASIVEVVRGVPSAIAQMLHDGEVDVALVPVAAVLGRADLRIIPGWCIGADGPVDSVLFVAETPPEQWRRLLLDGESRTSAMLSRLLVAGPLADRLRDDLVIEEIPPGTGVERAGGDVASLVIGDAARALPDRLGVRIDLAETWKTWTGLPFVFAVWAARGDLPADVREHMRAAAERGVAEIPERYTGPDLDYLGRAIRYPLDDGALMGLRRFAALANHAGLLGSPHVDLFGPAECFAPRQPVGDLLDAVLSGHRMDAHEALRLQAHARTSDLLATADMVRADHTAQPTVGWELVADIDLGDGDLEAQLDAAERAKADRLWLLGADSVADDELIRLVERLKGVAPVGLPCDALAGRSDDVLDQLIDAGLGRLLSGGLLGASSELGQGLDVPRDVVVASSVHETAEARVAALLSVRARLEAGEPIERLVFGALRTEKASKVDGETASEFLHTVALARLLLPTLPIEASWATHGLGTAQMSLHAGCDRFAPLRIRAGWDAEDVDVRIKAVELHIREAGLVPERRALGMPGAAAESVGLGA